jgi:hypothetical protein
MTLSSTSERVSSHAAADGSTREITIAHSPDSDDAFMFYGPAYASPIPSVISRPLTEKPAKASTM